MPWYAQLATGTSIAGVVLALAVTSAAGLALGSINLKGVSLGIAGVLFAGIAVADLFCGVIAGSMTSPPALSFARQLAGEGTAVAYGTVYPLAMILRVVSAQVLVIFWASGLG